MHFRSSLNAEDGESLYRYQVTEVIRKEHKYFGGECTLNPAWIDVHETHYCGQFKNYREQTATVEDTVWGNWQSKELHLVEAKNKELRAQLERAKARIKKLNPPRTHALVDGEAPS
jgi:hypothetical protein